MNSSDVFQIVSGAIVSVGGAGVIILKFSSYIGKMWAEKHLESIKREYQKELELYKFQLDMIKETAKRYSGKQFELYYELWPSLCNLKSRVERLWEKANEENLNEYIKQFEITKDEIEKNYLFIKETHYERLKELIKELEEFREGKEKLYELVGAKQIDQEDISRYVKRNLETKNKIKELIKEIGRDLKEHLERSAPE